jgi:hypothetical protein
VNADPKVIGDPTRIEEPNAITNRKIDGKIRRLVELGLKVKGK